MVAVGQDLRFHDRHDSGALADGGIARQHVGVLQDSELARRVLSDFQHASPLSEVAAILFVLDATCLQVVEALSRAFVVRAEKRYDAFVDLDAGDDVALLQQFDKRRAIVGLLVESFVEENHPGDMLPDDVLRE